LSGRSVLLAATSQLGRVRGRVAPPGGSVARFRARVSLGGAALGLCLVAAIVVGGGSAMVARPTPTPEASQVAVASALPSATPSAVPTATPTPTPTATPTPLPPSSAAVAMAIATKSSWVVYKSTTYKFSVFHPTDWTVSETQVPGWAIIKSPDSTPLQITWRAVPSGTTLDTVTAELWKTMHDTGYTVVQTQPATVAGLQANLLTVDGPATAAKPRHGVIALIVTTTGRYRIELWTSPGGDAAAAILFDDFLATFTIQ
jgi:hypothetical protein